MASEKKQKEKQKMKPRIRFDASEHKFAKLTYHIQKSLEDGKNGLVVVSKSTNLKEVGISEEYHQMIKDILAIPGVKKLEVADTSIEVIKIVAADWQADGIHQAIIDILKAVLHPGAKVEVAPVEGGDFSATEEKEEPSEEDLMAAMVSGLLRAASKEVCSIEIEFKVNFRDGKDHKEE